MKIAYKIRYSTTDKNDWRIAVIYDIDNWSVRSLSHKGLSDYQFTREMTDIEKGDFNEHGTRNVYCRYKSLDGFIEDENLCGVDPEFIDKVCEYYNKMVAKYSKFIWP